MPSTVNVTLPVGVPPAEELTVAVNATDCPYVEGLTDELIAVEVGERLSIKVTA